MLGYDANFPFTNGMSRQCRTWLTRAVVNASAEKRRNVSCVPDVREIHKNSAYVQNNPHCNECRKFGPRTAVRNTGDFTGKVWNCLQNNWLPAECLTHFKHLKKRVLEEEDEEEAL